jgi:hypothetical protein
MPCTIVARGGAKGTGTSSGGTGRSVLADARPNPIFLQPTTVMGRGLGRPEIDSRARRKRYSIRRAQQGWLFVEQSNQS